MASRGKENKYVGTGPNSSSKYNSIASMRIANTYSIANVGSLLASMAIPCTPTGASTGAGSTGATITAALGAWRAPTTWRALTVSRGEESQQVQQHREQQHSEASCIANTNGKADSGRIYTGKHGSMARNARMANTDSMASMYMEQH